MLEFAYHTKDTLGFIINQKEQKEKIVLGVLFGGVVLDLMWIEVKVCRACLTTHV